MDILSLEQVITPDRRTSRFSAFGLSGPDAIPATARIEWLQRDISAYDLSDRVPSDVRGYFETARRLHVFGFFEYRFFVVAHDRATLAAEMGLRARFAQLNPQFSARRVRETKLSGLLKWATDSNLLGEYFNAARLDGFRRLRNYAAHPETEIINSPADSAHTIEWTWRFISELWPDDY